MVSAHRIAILPSTPAARRVSAAVALANPPPSSKKSTSCASFVGICFDLNNCARASLFNHSAWGCRSQTNSTISVYSWCIRLFDRLQPNFMHLLQHRCGDWVGIARVARRRFVVEPRAPMTAQHSRDEKLADACAGSGPLPVLVRTHLVRNLP